MYDAIIVGARVAGAATGLLLARKGYRVLLLDKATFPSDTLSTHYVHVGGVARLAEWGLLERLRQTGCPPIPDVSFDFGEFSFSASPLPAPGGISEGYAPRRTIFDKFLIDAAVEAGCEFRDRYSVEALVSENGCVRGIRGRSASGVASSESARLTIGADGMRSVIAKLVDAPQYRQRPALTCMYYAYWQGIPLRRAEVTVRPKHTVLAFPTHDNLIVVVVSFPISEFPHIHLDHELAYLDPLPEAIRAGKRVSRVVGTGDLPNFFRRPFGNGWALVGDAGYHRDPLSAQGMTDALRNADFLSEAADAALSGREQPAAALERYEEQRNADSFAIYDFTCSRASYEPPSAEMMALLRALASLPEQAARFVGLDARTVRCEEFFAPANIQNILASAA